MDNKQLLKLMESIPFSQSDLDLNKKGILSEAQQKRIKRKTLIVFAAAAAFLLWFFIFFAMLFPARPLILGAGFFSFFAVLTIWLIRVFYNVNNHRGVKFVEGEPDYDITGGGRRSDIPHYFVKIGKLKFNVEESVYDAFTGKQVRVFYLQTPKKIILSLELF